MTEETSPSEGSRFRMYYAKPEYKERHLNYCKQKVECSCGKSVSRANMTHHKKTKKHQNILQQQNSDKEKMSKLLDLYHRKMILGDDIFEEELHKFFKKNLTNII